MPVCVPRFYSGVIALFSLWRLVVMEAQDNVIGCIRANTKMMAKHFLYHWGWVGGWGQLCAHMDKFYIYSGYFWDEESDFAIHFNLEPTVFALGGPEKVRPATENGAKRRLNVRISKLRHDH